MLFWSPKDPAYKRDVGRPHLQPREKVCLTVRKRSGSVADPRYFKD